MQCFIVLRLLELLTLFRLSKYSKTYSSNSLSDITSLPKRSGVYKTIDFNGVNQELILLCNLHGVIKEKLIEQGVKDPVKQANLLVAREYNFCS